MFLFIRLVVSSQQDRKYGLGTNNEVQLFCHILPDLIYFTLTLLFKNNVILFTVIGFPCSSKFSISSTIAI